MTRFHLTPSSLALSLFTACSSGISSRAPTPPHPQACTPLEAPSPLPTSLNVVIASFGNPSDAVGYYARTMRFVDAQLYETLVQVDCEGDIAPGLARTSKDTLAGRLTLTLRDDARFWNGEPLTSNSVLESWRSTPANVVDSIVEATRRIILAETTIVDDHSLSIPVALLRALADRSLAIRRSTTSSAWPEGTGLFRPTTPPERLDAITLAPARESASAPSLVVRTVPYVDARDQLDAGADLLLTSDLQTLSYASGRSDLVSVPLPWDRTYVLVAPSATSASTAATVTADTIRVTLARDVARVDARASRSPFWWTDSSCTTMSTSTAPRRDSLGAPTMESLAYRSDDPIARQLAERLVALAANGRPAGSPTLADLAPGVSTSRTVRAEALPPQAIAAAVSQGHRGFVLSIPAYRSLRCDRLDVMPRVTNTAAIIPLIDVRDHAIVRRGRASFVIDWEGIPHIGAPTP